MKTVLLTSNSFRHKYIAQCLAAETDLRLIITEEKSASIETTKGLTKEDADFVKEHFKSRTKSEQEFFRDSAFPESITRIRLKHKGINSEKTLDIIRDSEPDLIILFGTSIIKESLLNGFPGKIVNLHLGLSPYYKGSATNLFPLLYEQPQCIGATIHLAEKEVDSGKILHQLRPNLSENDNLHEAGNKVIKKAVKVLPDILEMYLQGKIIPVAQMDKGRICRIRDLGPEKLRNIYKNLENGLLSEYLEKKGEIDEQFPIISNLKS